MYKVLETFRDLRDGLHTYLPGDTFPREGITASPERIAELSGANNKRGRPLIVSEEETTPKKPAKPTQRRVKKNG